MESRVPQPTQWAGDETIEAWSVAEGGAEPRILEAGLALPSSEADLRPNPLIGEVAPFWPSERYAIEYGTTATWTNGGAAEDPARDRRLVQLPERW